MKALAPLILSRGPKKGGKRREEAILISLSSDMNSNLRFDAQMIQDSFRHCESLAKKY